MISEKYLQLFLEQPQADAPPPEDKQPKEEPQASGQEPAPEAAQGGEQSQDPAAGQEPVPVDAQGQPIQVLTPEDLGKVLQLKKLHTQLRSLSRLLDRFNGEEVDTIKADTSEAIELFNTISANLDKFEDVDELIDRYQDFLKASTEELELVAKSKKDEESE